MAALLAMIIAGIGIIPATVSAGGAYARSDGYDEERYVPRAVYPADRHVGSYRRDTRRTIYRRSNASDGIEAQDELPCVKRVVRESRRRNVERGDCRKPEPARTIHETTVVVNCPKSPPVRHAPKPRKVKPVCADPCPTDLQRLKVELLIKEMELDTALESARVNSIENQKMEVELAKLRERARNREAWIENYRKEYTKHNGWR